MPKRRRLLVKRKAFTRDGTKVPATQFFIEDRGAPGRGPKSIKVTNVGLMTMVARRNGLLKGDKMVTDLSDRDIGVLALSLADEVSPLSALRMFQSQINLRARAKGENLADRRKFEVGKMAIERRYFRPYI